MASLPGFCVLYLLQRAHDFAVLQSQSSSCDLLSAGCDQLIRVIHAMKYYSSSPTKEELTLFCQEIYKSLLDDFIHITQRHAEHFDIIMEIIETDYSIKCNFNECKTLQRQYQKNLNNQKIDTNLDIDDDHIFLFYSNLFISIHSFLLHSYDIGLRVSTPSPLPLPLPISEPNDRNFINIRSVIDKKAKTFESSRFSGNKFKVKINSQTDHDTNTTYLDALFDHLQQYTFQHSQLQKFLQFIQDNEYDSDALRQDIDITSAMSSNIAQQFHMKTPLNTNNTNNPSITHQAICICGDRLSLTTAGKCYPTQRHIPITVYCDSCTTEIDINTKVYHCNNLTTTKHPEGYDVCLSCYQDLQNLNINQNRSNQDNDIYELIKRYIERSIGIYLYI